jgi:hypothetical protein
MRGKNNSKQFTAGKKQAQNKILGRHNKPLQERKQELIANYYRKHRKEMQAWLKRKKGQTTAGYCRKGLKNLLNLKGCLSDRILLRQKIL